MEKERITQNEENNDGGTVHLYYNEDIGYYTAYGLSAFLITHVVEPVCSFSPSLQLPVVLVDKNQILELRRSLIKIKHEEKKYYQFNLKNSVGKSGYARWIKNLKNY
ncbi:MAG: hypothetical protein IK038_06415 [Bacteroidaceae bacterium]|nr:hypothetical protein [Bacteroidaceae bacterium]